MPSRIIASSQYGRRVSQFVAGTRWDSRGAGVRDMGILRGIGTRDWECGAGKRGQNPSLPVPSLPVHQPTFAFASYKKNQRLFK